MMVFRLTAVLQNHLKQLWQMVRLEVVTAGKAVDAEITARPENVVEVSVHVKRLRKLQRTAVNVSR